GHVKPLGLPRAEHDATGVVLRVVRHLRAVRYSDDLRAGKVSQLPHVVGVRTDGSWGNLVEEFEIDALARCRERTSQERLDVGLRRPGRMAAVQISDAGVRDEIGFRPSADRAQTHGDVPQWILRMTVSLEEGKDSHHPIDG